MTMPPMALIGCAPNAERQFRNMAKHAAVRFLSVQQLLATPWPPFRELVLFDVALRTLDAPNTIQRASTARVEISAVASQVSPQVLVAWLSSRRVVVLSEQSLGERLRGTHSGEGQGLQALWSRCSGNGVE